MKKIVKVVNYRSGRRSAPFKDGVPGKRWLEWFKKRHPCVSIEPAHAFKGKRRPELEREILAGRKKKLPWLLPMTPPMMLPMMHPMSLPLSEADGFAIVARDWYNGHSDVPTLNMQEAQDRRPLPHIQSAGDMGIMAVNNGMEMSAGMGIGMWHGKKVMHSYTVLLLHFWEQKTTFNTSKMWDTDLSCKLHPCAPAGIKAGLLFWLLVL